VSGPGGQFQPYRFKGYSGNENDARRICENWKKHSQEIYSEIIESLIKDRIKNTGENS